MAQRRTSQLIMELVDRVSDRAKRIGENLSRVTGTVDQVGAQQATLSQRIDTAMARNNRALGQARMGMVDAAAGAFLLYRGLGAPIRAAAGFEQSMNRVGVLSGAAEEQMETLGAQARELGRTTMFSASQAADGMGFLAQAGFDADQILRAMPTTLNLAAAGQLELSRAADIASNVLSGYGLAVEELERVNDVLVGTATTTNTSVAQMGEAMSFAAPVASMMGLEFEEAAAAIGLMGNAGIQASRAGTSLSAVLNQLTSPSDANAALMEDLGITVLDTEGNVRSLSAIMEDFEAAFGDVGDAVLDAEGNLLDADDAIERLNGTGERGRAILDLFGRRGGPAFAALLAQGSDALNKQTEAAQEWGGTAKRVADVEMEGLEGRMRAFRSAVEGVQIAIGTALLPAMTRLADVTADALQPIAELAEEYPKLTTSVVGAAAAVIAFRVALASLRYIGLLGKGGALAMLAFGMHTVGRAAGGMWRAAGSMIALQSSLALMSGQQMGKLARIGAGLRGMALAVPGLGKVGTALGAIAAIGLGKVAVAIAAIAGAGILIRRYWDRIGAIFRGVGEAVMERLQPAFDWLGDKLSFLEPITSKVAEGFSWLGDAVGDALSSISDFVGGLFDREVLTDEEMDAITARTSELVGSIIDGFLELPARLSVLGSQAMQRMREGMEEKRNEFIEWLGGLASDMIAAVGEIDLVRRGADTIASLHDGMSERFGVLLDWARTWPFEIGHRVAENGLSETGLELLQSLRDGIVGRFDKLLDWAAGIPGDISDRIAETDLLQVGRDIIQSLWDGMAAQFGRFIDWVRTIPQQIVDAIGSIDLSDAINWPQRPEWMGGDRGSVMDGRDGAAPADRAPSDVLRDRSGGVDLGLGSAADRFDGARARGGRVSRGGQYLVGEMGEEIFSPTRSGFIFPHSDAMAMLSAIAANPLPGLRLPDTAAYTAQLERTAATMRRAMDRATRMVPTNQDGEVELRGVEVELIAPPLEEGEDGEPEAVRPEPRDRAADSPGESGIGQATFHVTIAPQLSFPHATAADAKTIADEVMRRIEQETREAFRGVMADTGLRTY